MSVNDTKNRIELALRSAKLAKSALAMMEMSPTMAGLQFIEVIEQVKGCEELLRKMGGLK